jgi:glucose-6-phosphate dehydrogenase assembly protein OpcA
MIIDLPDTNVSTVAHRLVDAREEGGAVALGRVLTLVIVSHHGLPDAAIEVANGASREHPMRVIVLVTQPDGAARLDAQIRVGSDAGASEVVVLRAWGPAAGNESSLVTGLLLPDAPIVVWWPDERPLRPGSSPLGRIAQRRITDVATVPYSPERPTQLGM